MQLLRPISLLITQSEVKVQLRLTTVKQTLLQQLEVAKVTFQISQQRIILMQ